MFINFFEFYNNLLEFNLILLTQSHFIKYYNNFTAVKKLVVLLLISKIKLTLTKIINFLWCFF